MAKQINSTKNQKEPSVIPEATPLDHEAHSFAIVGIGASAGGLEALELFLRHVPKNSGLAYVIVQHLDPTHKGMLPEILQAATSMKVSQVKDRMLVKPDSVYVIPPNKDMSILHGRLHLFEPELPRGMRLPIDFFLRSLADDRKQFSVGIILSGMGSDGTAGLQAIREKSGLVGAQDPESAKFDSMPRSAINAGLADIVAPPEQLPKKILDFFQHLGKLDTLEEKGEDSEQNALEKVAILLRSMSGHDFSNYKKNTILRRIERRMGIHQINKLTHYVRFLQENPQELKLLFKELLIGVTNFFRDPAEWEILKDDAIPWFLSGRPEGGTIRAWCAGCSTGEEAYSLAIVFCETLERLKTKHGYSLQIFATDLDPDAINKARRGIFPASIAADVSPERLNRYFKPEGNGYQVSQQIREMITFATQNVIMDPPFTKLDIVICRNLLIYLNAQLQKKLLPLFHYSLKDGGVLFLGSAESVNTFNHRFTPLQPKSRVFRKRTSDGQVERVDFPSAFVLASSDAPGDFTMHTPKTNLQSLTDQLILRNYSTPAVLVNESGDILYINGRTGKYLEPAAGKANWNIFAMARDSLRFEVTNAFQKAVAQKETISVNGLVIEDQGHSQRVDMQIQPLTSPEELSGMLLIVFKDVATPVTATTPRSKQGKISATRITDLELELSRSHEELQAAREGMQSSQEELKSMNEELQSTNEELQSTNEELTTSKEELQSMNEELQSVNAEQTSKMHELTIINSDMNNLLNSTDIITVFLDKNLKIRRFTTGAVEVFKLIPSDIGRPLTDINSDLLYPELATVARGVLSTLNFDEREITTTDGRWFRVRIMPYRSLDDKIDGVVMTFTNISAAKKLEAKLRATANMFQKIVQSAETMVICISPAGDILEINPVAEKLLECQRADVLHKDFFELFLSGETYKQGLSELKHMLSFETPSDSSTPLKTKTGKRFTIEWAIGQLQDVDGKPVGLIAIGSDFSTR